MTTIVSDHDLGAGDAPITGWETSAAAVGNVVVYTGNWFAAYSLDSGETFTWMDPNSVCGAWGESLCCDQVVIYLPQIETFAWLLQTNAGNYVLAIATPQEIADFGGKAWTSYLIRSTLFDPAAAMDYPEIAVGANSLYLTFNLIGKNSVAVRVPLSELRDRAPLGFSYFQATGDYWLRPVQHTGTLGAFVCLPNTSTVRVYHWPENDYHVWSFDVPIATIPTEDFTVNTPDGADWLGPTSKVDWHIYGATQTGRQIWVAWNGARRVSGRQDNAFAYPQIGLAMIDVDGGLIGQRFIWNASYGFAWPALATNLNGDVGLSFCFAGERDDPQYGVATLTGPAQTFLLVTSGPSMGAGGHYIGVRRSYPNEALFCGAGFNQPKPVDGGEAAGHPHFTVFGP